MVSYIETPSLKSPAWKTLGEVTEVGNILVTGGLGYIGSHTVVELLGEQHSVLIMDNLSNSDITVLDRIERITGTRTAFVKADVRDEIALRRILDEGEIEAVIHFAGLKAVGESVALPLRYFDNNVVGTLRLIEEMQAAGVRKLVFSSSATVYGDPPGLPIREDFPLHPTNPYGRSKLMVEEILRDVAQADPTWRIGLLRYFNPAGAHVSGLIGEAPRGIPNNLMPFVCQAAAGHRAELSIFGSDYPTADGTGVRDYIHVVDLAKGHLCILRSLDSTHGVQTFNLGTGRGYSVLEVIRAFEEASGQTVPFRIVARRPGDVAQCYADPSLAQELLGWRAKLGLTDMCRDSWRWQVWVTQNVA